MSTTGSRRGVVLVLVGLVALGLLASGCTSSDSVDASALPTPGAPVIGLAANASLTSPVDLPTFDDGNGHGGVPPNGRYQLGVRGLQSVVTSTMDEDFPPDQVVTASFTTTGSPSDTGFGVICRMRDDDNYYRLGVGNDGEFAIQRVVAGKTTVLTGNGKWVAGPTIRTTPGPFTVRAECIGDALTLYESNHQIASVIDTTVTGGSAGVFVESFFKPDATVQVDALSVQAFRDRAKVADAVAAGWGGLMRAQRASRRCELLDRTRANVDESTAIVTRCGPALLMQVEPPARGTRVYEQLLDDAGTSPTVVKGLPGCPRRTGVRGLLPAPTAAGTPGDGPAIGRVACLDLGHTTAVLWVNRAAGVIGVERIKPRDQVAWKGYGPDWPPFALVAPAG